MKATMLLSLLLLTLAAGPAGAVSAQSDPAASGLAAAVPEIVEGSFGRPTERSPGTVGTRSDGAIRSRNQVFAGIVVEASDSRLRGTASIVSSSDSRSTLDGGSLDVFVETYDIVNADGGWSGTLTGFRLPGDSGEIPSSLVLRGIGGYEGLTAVLIIDFAGLAASGGGVPFEGAIFIGRPPPVPAIRDSE